MKKIVLAICIVIGVALLVSTQWGTKAVDAPPDGTMGTPDTTLGVALSFDEMIAQSDVIAIGNCVDTKSVWVDRTLVTVATVSVSETLKGGETSSLTVVLPGGSDSNRKFPIAVSYPGAPRLTPGEDVFLFLTADTDTGLGYNVAGFAQGKFSILSDEDGQPVVTRDLSKMTLQGNNGVRRGSATVFPLGSFKDQVKARLSQ